VAHTTAHSASGATSEEALEISRVVHAARINISQETRRVSASTHNQSDGEDQFCCPSPLQTLQFQLARDSQQLLRLNQNAECQRRRHGRRQQIENSAEAIYSADSEREVHTHVSFKQREDRASVPECESCILQQCEVRVKRETRILPALICEVHILSVSERDAYVSNSKRDGRVSIWCEVRISIQCNARLAFSIACLQDIKCQKALTPRGLKLVP